MAVRLAVDPNEDLDQLIEDIKAQPSKEIVLSLPQETRALQTLDNFYALRNMVRTAGVNLSITGGSKQTRGLAKLLGFAVDKDSGGEDDDGGAREIFGNAPTMAPAPPSNNGGLRNTTPFGMPEGFVVNNPQNGSAPPANPAPAQPPPVQTRNAQDFFNEMRDFNPGLPNTPLQPPPANRNDFNGNAFGGDQVLTRENIPDFFDTGGAASPRQAPPPPQANFDLEGGGRTMSFEEATRSGLFGGGGPGLGTFEPGPGLEDVGLADDEIPAVPSGGDTAADRFRRPRGVRNPDEAAAGARTGRRIPGIGRRNPRRDPQAATAAMAGTAPSNSRVLNRVRRLLVPVEPKGAGGGLMAKPTQSPEEIKRREAQRRQTTMMTLLGVLLVAVLFIVLFIWLFRGGGVDVLAPPQVALTVPLKTQVQDQTVRLQLVPGGTTGGVSGVNQAPGSTPAGTAAATPAAAVTTTPDLGSASPGAAGTPGATATVSTAPTTLPVNLINTGDLKVSDQAAATGTRTVPDKPASGPVTFINRGSSAKGFGAGTVIYSANGINYRLVDGVTVGGGNVFSGAAGSAKGTVVADKAGPAGNVDKAVSRLLSDSMGVTIGPIAGGSDRQEKFVTQADQDNLKKQLQDKAKNQANSQVKYDPATEAVLVIKSTDPTCDFSKKVNDTADNFTGTCTMSLQAAVYNTKVLTDQVKAAYNSNPNYKLDDSTPVKLLDSQVQQSGSQIFVNIKASGRVVPTLDLSAFRTDIANKSKADVNTILQTKYSDVVNVGMMNLDGISKDTLPDANQLQITTVPDTQMPPANASTTPSGAVSPGAGNNPTTTPAK